MKPFILTLCLLGVVLSPAFAERQFLDRVVAVVNDEAITQSELDSLLRPLYESYKKEYDGEQLMRMLDEARLKLLNQLIEDRLVMQQAKAQAIEVDEAEIDSQMEKFKSKFVTEQALEDALKHEGMNLNTMRDRLRRQTMMRHLQDREIRSKIVVSPLDIDEYYQSHPDEFSDQERLKVRSITLRKSDEAKEKGLTDEAAKNKLQEIKKRILSGEDFGELAKEFSEDSNAGTGGLTNWVQRSEMIPVIDQYIFKMKEGEISEILETPMGYHLFRLEERQEGHKRTLDEVRDDIYMILFRKKAEEKFNEWIQDLKRNAYISIR